MQSLYSQGQLLYCCGLILVVLFVILNCYLNFSVQFNIDEFRQCFSVDMGENRSPLFVLETVTVIQEITEF